MKIINASFFIKEEKREEFLTDIKELIKSTLQEKGCIAYHLYESIEEANAFIMVESWENQQAIDNHNQNPLLHKLGQNLAEYSSKEPVLLISDLSE